MILIKGSKGYIGSHLCYYLKKKKIKFVGIDFTFHGTGMCKIKKITNCDLREPKKINTRRLSIKNFLRKILKR